MRAYYDNYRIDTGSRVILDVEATPALSRQEMLAAHRMVERVEKFGLRPESLGADKSYGSGEFLAWLLSRASDRSSASDGWTLHPRPVPLPFRGERLLLPGRKTVAVSRSTSHRARFFLLFDSSSVLGMSAETALYANRLSQAVYSLG